VGGTNEICLSVLSVTGFEEVQFLVQQKMKFRCLFGQLEWLQAIVVYYGMKFSILQTFY